LSAADRPSAIFFARSSSAFTMGGHTKDIVNHTRMKNTAICANRVALRLTATPF
jgi:cation transporter-like permease